MGGCGADGSGEATAGPGGGGIGGAGAFASQRGGDLRIQSRNREQTFALDLLLDPEIQLITLVGKARTGKTLLALAAGLHQVADERLYERLLVTRPVISLGKEIGFLPGDLDEKMGPWMQPIIDNLDFLLGGGEAAGPA